MMTMRRADTPRPANDSSRQWIEANQRLASHLKPNENAEIPTYSAFSEVLSPGWRQRSMLSQADLALAC